MLGRVDQGAVLRSWCLHTRATWPSQVPVEEVATAVVRMAAWLQRPTSHHRPCGVQHVSNCMRPTLWEHILEQIESNGHTVRRVEIAEWHAALLRSETLALLVDELARGIRSDNLFIGCYGDVLAIEPTSDGLLSLQKFVALLSAAPRRTVPV